jgi:hypothetical protein
MAPHPRLIALDEDDLAVISAHVQDAAVQVRDIIWRQAERRLVIGMKRLDWDQALSGAPAPLRLVAALRFDRVLACKSRHLDMSRPDLEVELLGVEFRPGAKPGGNVLLMFSGGGALRLDVECIECELADLGEDHFETDDAAGPGNDISAETGI